MPFVQEIWVTNNSGVILFNLQLGGTTLQEEMLGGFIAALENFCSNLARADVKSIVIGTTRFTLAQLGVSGMIIAMRTESDIPEKKVNKSLQELREKLYKYLQKKGTVNPQNLQLKNLGFSLELDDEINDIFFSLS